MASAALDERGRGREVEASGVTATPGAPAPPEGPRVLGAPPGARKKFFAYFSFSYQNDKKY